MDDEAGAEAEVKSSVMRRSSVLVFCSALAAPLGWSPNALGADTPADVSARQRALFERGPRAAVITRGVTATGVAAGAGTVLAVVAASKWSAASDRRDGVSRARRGTRSAMGTMCSTGTSKAPPPGPRRARSVGRAGGTQVRTAEHRRGVGIAHRASPLYGVAVTAAGVSLAGCSLRPADVTVDPTHLSWYPPAVSGTRTVPQQRAGVLLQEALAKLAAVWVETEPEGAEVTVDGAVLGWTPLALPVFLEPGQHVIGAELNGYRAARETIMATAGQTLGVTLPLEPVRVEMPVSMSGPGTEGPLAASATPGDPRERASAPGMSGSAGTSRRVSDAGK
ncbi:PEGA domain-containing protein [Sorangium sp. So ce124]|uniref:PEGA domain-containing protein n=1 Tax=Sorangium sp. So ce124 TaxID=3133280 RepID=UPI003F5FB18C